MQSFPKYLLITVSDVYAYCLKIMLMFDKVTWKRLIDSSPAVPKKKEINRNALGNMI